MPGNEFPLFTISPLLSVILVIILSLSLFFEQKAENRKKDFFVLLFVFIWFALLLFITGLSADRLSDPDNTIQRISLSAGFWFSLFSLYILLFCKRHYLNAHPLIKALFSGGTLFFLLLLLLNKTFDSLSLMKEYTNNSERFVKELINHISIAFTSVGWGIAIGMPLAIWAWKSRRVEKAVLPFVKLVQTIPSLSMFGLLIPPLSFLAANVLFFKRLGISGIGDTPAIVALSLYALLPIVQNTYTGLKQVDEGVVDAARGMGMTPLQRFLSVEFLIALPSILTGIRTAMVQIIGNTTMAALIGAGGLGIFIFQGLGQGAMDLILLGAVPIIILALIADSGMNILQTRIRKLLLFDRNREVRSI